MGGGLSLLVPGSQCRGARGHQEPHPLMQSLSGQLAIFGAHAQIVLAGNANPEVLTQTPWASQVALAWKPG